MGFYHICPQWGLLLSQNNNATPEWRHRHTAQEIKHNKGTQKFSFFQILRQEFICMYFGNKDFLTYLSMFLFFAALGSTYAKPNGLTDPERKSYHTADIESLQAYGC
jgi:hypothetical protein